MGKDAHNIYIGGKKVRKAGGPDQKGKNCFGNIARKMELIF